MPALFLVIILFINLSESLLITKQVTLTPNTPSQNGVIATVLDANIINSKWRLYDGTDNEEFGLSVTLNSSWGFHPSEITTLTIEVNANANTGVSSLHDLMVAFTQYPYDRYFTTVISMGYETDHKIYPFWDQSFPYSPYAYGNIKSIVDTYNEGYSRFQKTYRHYQYFFYQPPTNVGYRYVTSPLTFTLENRPDPNDYMLYHYSNPSVSSRWCAYNAMTPNTEMTIYFAGDQWSDSIDISSITMTLEYTITDAPTYNPTKTPIENPTKAPIKSTTNNPTLQPTYNPTKITKYPTSQPSTNPTVQPTYILTNDPTSQPTYTPTRLPTINPTVIPSGAPSQSPSSRPTAITNVPSHSSTNYTTDNPIKPESAVGDKSTTARNQEVEIDENNEKQNGYLYMIIGVVSALVVIIIIAVIIMLRKLKNKAVSNEENLSKTQRDDVTKSENKMAIKPDVGIEGDDLYKVQSGEMNSVTTPSLDTELIFNGSNMAYDEEGGDNEETEAMYDIPIQTKTAGNDIITDKGYSNKETAIYDHMMTKTTGNCITTDKGDSSDDEETDGITHSMRDMNDDIVPRDEVKKWLNGTVELPQYYDVFVQNGLDSLKLIAKLDDNEALFDLGIELKEHRMIIMKYIKELSMEDGRV